MFKYRINETRQNKVAISLRLLRIIERRQVYQLFIDDLMMSWTRKNWYNSSLLTFCFKGSMISEHPCISFYDGGTWVYVIYFLCTNIKFLPTSLFSWKYQIEIWNAIYSNHAIRLSHFPIQKVWKKYTLQLSIFKATIKKINIFI